MIRRLTLTLGPSVSLYTLAACLTALPAAKQVSSVKHLSSPIQAPATVQVAAHAVRRSGYTVASS
jgi:hypothetical protein